MKNFLKLNALLIFVISINLLAACSNSTNSQEESTKTASKSETSDEKVIRVGATGQSFPNSYQEDGKLIGFDVEVLETIANNLGYKVQWTLAGFEGLVGQLGVGKLDTIANAFEYTEERAEQYNYSTTYSYTSTGIAVLKDSPYDSVKDLNGQTVAGVLGSNKINVLED